MKKLSTQRITLIALFIVINIVGGHIALLAKLPVYLDTIGTLLGAFFWSSWWRSRWYFDSINKRYNR